MATRKGLTGRDDNENATARRRRRRRNARHPPSRHDTAPTPTSLQLNTFVNLVDNNSGHPVIVVPLHACGSAVRVTGVQPNRLVGIDANVPNTSLWWAIGMAWATETTVDVSVNAAFMNQALQFRPFELDCGVKTTGPAVQMPKVAQFSAPEVGDPAPNDPANLSARLRIDSHQEHVSGVLVDLYRFDGTTSREHRTTNSLPVCSTRKHGWHVRERHLGDVGPAFAPARNR